MGYTYKVGDKPSATQFNDLAQKTDLAASGGAGLVGWIQSAVGAVLRWVADKLAETKTIEDFGGVGDWIADDTLAVQKACAYMVANKCAIRLTDGKSFRVTQTTVINGWFGIYGNGTIGATDPALAVFTLDINTASVSRAFMKDFMAQGPVTTNPLSCVVRVIGDNVSHLQRCTFAGLRSSGFNTYFKEEKTPRATVNGLEAMTNWCIFKDFQSANLGSALIWFTKGSGTGNGYHDTRASLLNPGTAILKFEGDGCVVGDIIVAGGHWNCEDAAGADGIYVGDNTVYRAQIAITGTQFDASINTPIRYSAVGAVEYVNLNLTGNNIGGAANLGAGLQPMSRAVVCDRDVSDWKAGKTYANSTTGALTVDCFLIDFGTFGSLNFDVDVNGTVGGLQATFSEYSFSARTDGVAAEIIESESLRGLVSAGFAVTVTAVSASQLKVSVSFSPTGGGSNFNATIRARGVRFKITRL